MGCGGSMRATDWENKIAPRQEGGDPERAAKMFGITPKSPFQIGGSGSVGTGSLRAMPFLLRLREAGFRVWPFEDAALDAKRPQPLLVEMYTRLLTGRGGEEQSCGAEGLSGGEAEGQMLRMPGCRVE